VTNDRVEVGVVSDTHGLLRPEAVQALQGVDVILHAGDVGDPLILQQLVSLAPVFVVRGNVDRAPWADALPSTEVVEVAGVTFFMLHELEQLDLDPGEAGIDVVVYGHSHRPDAEEKDGVLYLNPGSAGPRRFDLPVTVARLSIGEGTLEAGIVSLV
jgi:putative phosphoesterase